MGLEDSKMQEVKLASGGGCPQHAQDFHIQEAWPTGFW